MATTTKRTRSERLEVRTTPEERGSIDRAVAVTDSDLTDFVVTNLTVAARRVLADRSEFTLDDEAAPAWERINRRAGPEPRRPARADGPAVAIRRVTQGYRPPRLLEPPTRLDAFERAGPTSRPMAAAPCSPGPHATGTTKVIVVTPGRAVARRRRLLRLVHGEHPRSPTRHRRACARVPAAIRSRSLCSLGSASISTTRAEGSAPGSSPTSSPESSTWASEIGCRGLLIHAESRTPATSTSTSSLRSSFPTDELHLVLLMKDIRRTLCG